MEVKATDIIITVSKDIHIYSGTKKFLSKTIFMNLIKLKLLILFLFIFYVFILIFFHIDFTKLYAIFSVKLFDFINQGYLHHIFCSGSIKMKKFWGVLIILLFFVTSIYSIPNAGESQWFIFSDDVVIDSVPAQITKSGKSAPLSISSADFDGDGIPDLATGYYDGEAGLLRFQMGNEKSLFPRDTESIRKQFEGIYEDPAFLPSSLIMEIPAKPDFLISGDFDNDGRQDLISGAAKDSILYFIKGDGVGGFILEDALELPGKIDALKRADVNRPDNLMDFIVAVTDIDVSYIMVFESPDGAIKADPEILELPGPASEVITGPLGQDCYVDIIAACGKELLIFEGRNRRLSHNKETRFSVPDAKRLRRVCESGIRSITLGDFAGDLWNELILLSETGELFFLDGKKKDTLRKITSSGEKVLSVAPVSPTTRIIKSRSAPLPGDEILIYNSENPEMEIMHFSSDKEIRKKASDLSVGTRVASSKIKTELPPIFISPLRLNTDALEDLLILGHGDDILKTGNLSIKYTQAAKSFVVDSEESTGDYDTNDGLCKACLEYDIDNNCIEWGCTLAAALQQTEASEITGNITFSTGIDYVEMENPPEMNKGTAVIAGPASRVVINGGISSEYLELNHGYNVLRNLVLQFNNNKQVHLGGGSNIVEGVYVGTNSDGTFLYGNGGRISVSGSLNKIGGPNENQRNLLSQGANVVSINSNYNEFKGNYFGVDASGESSFDTPGNLTIFASSGCQIGGSAAGEGNLFVGNSLTATAIDIDGEYDGKISSSGHIIQGNYFGTDKDGERTIGLIDCGTAIKVQSTSNTLIGGTAGVTVGGPLTGAGNLIAERRGAIWLLNHIPAGNGQWGSDITIQGNYIGTDVTGKITDPDGFPDSGDEFGNTSTVILIGVYKDTLIGGVNEKARNLISGNFSYVIEFQGTSNRAAVNTSIMGNYIGTDISGMKNLGNKQAAIFCNHSPAPESIIIGGSEGTSPDGPLTGAGNLISGNKYGIHLQSIKGVSKIQGNFIGTDVRGGSEIPNQGTGVYFIADETSGEVLIGGIFSIARNVISGNHGFGLHVGGKKPLVKGNYIGVCTSGTKTIGNHYGGIRAYENSVIGGDISGEGNVISGNMQIEGGYDFGVGVVISGDHVVLKGNKIGTDPTGTIAMPNESHGIILDGDYCTIGGPTKEEGNLISANKGNGIFQEGSEKYNVIQGNIIGTDITGKIIDPDGIEDSGDEFGNRENGIRMIDNASSFTIGGNSDIPGIGPGNLISGNRYNGIYHYVSYDPADPAMFNVIQGNLVGTDITGEKNLGNGHAGIRIVRTAANKIGGANYEDKGEYAGNVISGNGQYGLNLGDARNAKCRDNIVQGNYIGTNILGDKAIPNGDGGIHIYSSASDNLIGGSSPHARNIISGNYGSGIYLEDSATKGNVIKGNIIGMDETGTKKIGNIYGITFDEAEENIIGGVGSYENNIISGNTDYGIHLKYRAKSNIIQNNYIGLDSTGMKSSGNGLSGIRIENYSENNLIGGKEENQGNLISGNEGDGIYLTNNASGNRIYGNRIGSLECPNVLSGIDIDNCGGNYIGGGNPAAPDEGKGNIISGNTEYGVTISGVSASENVLYSNYIGLDTDGDNAVPNQKSGVRLYMTHDNIIGGKESRQRNIISGNKEYGVIIEKGSWLNKVQGNYIGLWEIEEDDFTTPFGNEKSGVLIDNSERNVIGGDEWGAGNVISQNTGFGVHVKYSESTQNKIQGNIIGLDPEGEKCMGNSDDGVHIDTEVTQTLIGGTAEAARNIISGNGGDGVEINGMYVKNNTVQNNFIGTSASGLFVIPEFGLFPDESLGNRGNGIRIVESESNKIGGRGTFEGNLISGNHQNGIFITGEFAKFNRILNNLTGTDKDCAKALPNEQHGMSINNTPRTLIGGDTIDDTNIISGNKGSGIYITGEKATQTSITGNVIGADHDSFYELPNKQGGIVVNGVEKTYIGGTRDGTGNLISGNEGPGIKITGETASLNVIRRNFIGTNLSGDKAIPNTEDGILIENAPGNIIGEKDSGNLVSGNADSGIKITGTTAITNQIAANYIGVDKNADKAIPNGGDGVHIENANQNIVGVTDLANVISGNKGNGVQIKGETATRNLVQNNMIGTDLQMKDMIGNEGSGVHIFNSSENLVGGEAKGLGNIITASKLNGVHIGGVHARQNVLKRNVIGVHDQVSTMTNTLHGVLIANSAQGNMIGGDQETSNTIYHNGGDGIRIFSGDKNSLYVNCIFRNNGLGIDLGGDGVTANDVLDADVGANAFQNYPEIESVLLDEGTLDIEGTLNSSPDSEYLIHFYANEEVDATGYGEGYILIGSITVTTGADGNASLNTTIDTDRLKGVMHLSATATDTATSATSEFSECLEIIDLSNLPPDLLASKILMGEIKNPTPDDIEKADINGDGVIDVADIIKAMAERSGTDFPDPS